MIEIAIAMMAALLQVPCASTPKPTTVPALTVEVVDPVWLPVPGAEIVVTLQGPRRESWRAITGEDGTAPFWIQRTGKYVIEAKIPGFKKRRLNNVTVGAVSTTPIGARVQLRLSYAGPMVTVY